MDERAKLENTCRQRATPETISNVRMKQTDFTGLSSLVNPKKLIRVPHVLERKEWADLKKTQKDRLN